MKRLKDKIVRTPEDRPCQTCANTFRQCPLEIVLAFDRVPEGMEVAVIHCPAYRPRDKVC